MIVEKDIARVSVGSFVVEIVKQRGDTKIKTKGWVRDLKAIEHLIDIGVERVLIDTSKVLDNQTPIKASVREKKVQPTSNAPKREFSEELTEAKAIFDKSKTIQTKILDDIVCGRPLDIEPIKAITDETTEAIFQNPDALAYVINIREKDEYLLEHSTSVAILMTIFCRYKNFDVALTKELAVGAFLHDVGKIKIDDQILNKPGKLTVQEFEIIKGHVNHSIDIIKATNGISDMSLEVAAQHHEKLDGSGYPKKLAQEQISLYGRMIAVCDIFDALTADRVYKDGMAHVKAFAILLEMGKKGLLDQTLVNGFVKCMGVYPIGSLVKLNSEQLAVVESKNINDPIRPKVKVFYNTKQEHFLQAKDVDLSADLQKHIEKGVRAQDFNLNMNKILEFLILEA